jgi:hypothetical protein
MITFPRDMPPCRISALSTFDLQHGVAISQAGGSVQAMELAPAIWKASFTTEPLSAKQRAQVQAWWATLKGGVGTFFAWDCFRAWPQAYGNSCIGMPRAGGGTFDGLCQITANNTTTVNLATLPAGFIFTDGDMLELVRQGTNKISLHNITEDAVASGAGTVTVSIEPPALSDTAVPNSFVRLVKARCVMVPKPGSFSAPAGLGRGAAQFEAVQTLR